MQQLKRFHRSKGWRSRLAKLLLIIFIVLNVFAYVGAYSFTHFRAPGQWGLGLVRPDSQPLPTSVGLEYSTHRIPVNQNEWLETWTVPTANPIGTVLLFPGHGVSKAKFLAPARVFHDLGYDTLMTDFRGVGGSSGNTTTIGFREAEDVALAMRYAQNARLKPPFILYGVSMGSAAILKAAAEQMVKPDAIMVELPFAYLANALRSRVKAMHLPVFPTAEFMVFWGSIQHRFNGFAHNPAGYARQIQCPTLILHGQKDKWTSVADIKKIYQNLSGPKQLVLFPKAGHNLLVTVDKPTWRRSVTEFLTQNLS
jgi:uncharacterized protein